MKLRLAISRLLALFRKRNLDRELDGEVVAHLELAERDAMAQGLPPEEARQAARRSFGGIEQMKEDHRDRRSVRWMENLLRDFRYGMASLARTPDSPRSPSDCWLSAWAPTRPCSALWTRSC